jgi:hypothetical protein
MQGIGYFVENTTNRLAYGILSHHQVHFDICFFAPNANQFRAPFLCLKPLNGHLLHTIIEFKGFGFGGMAFRRLALGISSAVTTCCGASSCHIASKFPADGRMMYPNLLGDFFLASSGLKGGLNLIPLFKTELGVVFFHVQFKDCTAR